MDGDLQRRARGSRRRRSGRARGAAPTCSAIRNALSARQGRGYPWMGISSGERVAAAGGGLVELAARPHLQLYLERPRRPAGGRYPWGRSPAGERVAAAGGGLAELAARPHLQRDQERSERPTGARVPMDGDLQWRARGSRRRRSGRARGAAPTCSAIRNALSARQGRGYPWMGISSGERVAAAGGGLAELAARPHLQRYQERSERPTGARVPMDGDLQRRARGSRRRRSGRARGAAPTCSAIRNALSARQGRGYPWGSPAK
ncbi:hypothetical protein WH04_14050 [Aeromonas salmonicida subsp. salmonicida]|nr:hypothetical protein WH04_14050 [Aeromonas salmonicida subsp. salmonicida]